MNPVSFAIGLIGCGQFGHFLAQAAMGTGRIGLKAVCDQDQQRAAHLATELDAEACDGVAALCARPDIEAVLIATPPAHHAAHAIAALQAGKHVFLEKPMALSEADCTAINHACAESGRQLMVGHVLRWFEPYRAIAAAYRAGLLGQALHGSFWRLEHDFLKIAPWKGQRAGSGGYLFEVAAHELDWLRSVFGEVQSIAAGIDKRQPSTHQLEDRVALQLGFADGFCVHYLGGTGFPANSHGFCLRFENTTIESDAAFDPARVRITEHGPHPITLAFSAIDPYRAELDAWLDCLATQQTMPVTGEDAAATVALIASTYRHAGW